MQPHDGRSPSNFIMQALLNSPVIIVDDVTQTHSFCDVDNLTQGIKVLMNTPRALALPESSGSPGEFAVRELAEKIIALKGSSAPTASRMPQDGPIKPRTDIQRAERLLNREARIHCDDGLPGTIECIDDLAFFIKAPGASQAFVNIELQPGFTNALPPLEVKPNTSSRPCEPKAYTDFFGGNIRS